MADFGDLKEEYHLNLNELKTDNIKIVNPSIHEMRRYASQNALQPSDKILNSNFPQILDKSAS